MTRDRADNADSLPDDAEAAPRPRTLSASLRQALGGSPPQNPSAVSPVRLEPLEKKSPPPNGSMSASTASPMSGGDGAAAIEIGRTISLPGLSSATASASALEASPSAAAATGEGGGLAGTSVDGAEEKKDDSKALPDGLPNGSKLSAPGVHYIVRKGSISRDLKMPAADLRPRTRSAGVSSPKEMLGRSLRSSLHEVAPARSMRTARVSPDMSPKSCIAVCRRWVRSRRYPSPTGRA